MREKHTTATITATAVIGPRNGTENGARLALLALRADLQHRMSKRETLVVERHADPVDESLQISERERAAVEKDVNTARLHAIEGALERIEAGTWGVCEDCDEPIGPRRLAALPWASRCLACQEAQERN